MASITLKNQTGGDAGTVELDDKVFGIQPNVPVMHQVVTAQLAGARSGTQSTKTRAEVCGDDDLNVALSFRNLQDCHPILFTELNAYDVLVSDVVLFTKATLPNTTPATPVEVTKTEETA